MDLVSKSHSINHVSRALLSPITSPQPGSLFRTSSLHHQNDNTSFPIIAIAIIGILATAFLLVSYYVFVIKCCLNWHRIDLLRRFSLSAAANRAHEELLMASAYPPGSLQTRGLDESAIRSIPVFHFRKDGLNLGICPEKKSIDDDDDDVVKFSECAVCLNEFEEDEKLRIIPNCAHIFHIDCIDVWLQSNANCPLCRTSISTNRFQFDPVISPSPSPIGPDEDYVVIELSNNNNNNNNNSSNGTDQIGQRAAATAAAAVAAPTPAEASPRKIENSKKKKRFSNKGTSMGDECIDTREKDDVFAVQPIRRSVSMDSSADRKMFLAIQEAVRHCREGSGGEVIASVSPIEGGCSTSSTSNSNTNIRVKRSFFSFGHGRGGSSRSAVLPVYLEP